jgi:hypothetical protein
MPNDTVANLLDEVKALVSTAEELLQATTADASQHVVGARERATRTIEVAKSQIADWEAAAVQKTKAAAQGADRYVHEHPWTAIGLGTAIGVVLGLLIRRNEP